VGLWLDQVAGPFDPVDFVVGAGECRRLEVDDPDALVAVLAGTRAANGRAWLDDEDVLRLSAGARRAAGLAVATGRIADLPGLRVVDVLLLGRPHVGLWRSLIGRGGDQQPPADEDEADARALAGRMGLGPWLDLPAADLPPAVRVLTDAVRALVAGPAALVWRDPDWLDAADRDGLVETVRTESGRGGVATVRIAAVGESDP
jgi:ABC-type branched-subunit amino acid transport system ATPase component